MPWGSWRRKLQREGRWAWGSGVPERDRTRHDGEVSEMRLDNDPPFVTSKALMTLEKGIWGLGDVTKGRTSGFRHSSTADHVRTVHRTVLNM